MTDAFLGSDLMLEDFEGYNGRIADYQWQFKGTRNLLLPMYAHNTQKFSPQAPAEADGFKRMEFGGQGGCFPLNTWQLRTVYVIEGIPTDAAHPIKRRELFMDAQTSALTRVDVYDKKGELWKSLIVGKSHADAHLPVNKGAGVALDDTASMIDWQARHCTTISFRAEMDAQLAPLSLFSVQNLRNAAN